MTREPRWLNRLRRLEIFDESREIYRGPRWAWALAIGCAAAAIASLAGALHCLLARGCSAVPWGLGYIAAFAVVSGATWHLGMRARAANQIIMCLIGLGALWWWKDQR